MNPQFDPVTMAKAMFAMSAMASMKKWLDQGRFNHEQAFSRNQEGRMSLEETQGRARCFSDETLSPDPPATIDGSTKISVQKMGVFERCGDSAWMGC